MQHSFDIDIAKEYGILEAVLLNNLHFWLEKNRANGTNFYDGDYWTFNSAKAFAELFPYASKRQIEKALMHLREEEVIKVGNYNKLKYDRTLWYALTEKGKCLLHFGEMPVTNRGNGQHTDVTPIPDINPTVNPDKKTKYIRHKYGEYQNVLLTDEDMDKLKAEFPNDYNSRIDNLSMYIASTGKTYKNHLATIRNWARKEKPQKRKNDNTPTWTLPGITEL